MPLLELELSPFELDVSVGEAPGAVVDEEVSEPCVPPAGGGAEWQVLQRGSGFVF